MKKILYILILSILALTSCKQEQEYYAAAQREDILFSIDLNSEKVAVSKATAIQNGDIANLHLLIFDQNGRFISRHLATRVANFGDYKATLPVLSSPCIIHFVANYDWTAFSDVAAIGKNETEIIPSLAVSGTVVAYWQRVELASISSTSFDGQTINLLRNILKVSTINKTPTATLPRLANMSFALGDVYDRGTVSPFRTSSSTPFVEGDASIAEPTASIYKTITVGDFVTSGTSAPTTGVSINSFERKNVGAARPAYIIIRGYYQDSANPTNSTVLSYYKIDFADPGATVLQNLQRNYLYTVNINSVTNGGYPTLAEAMHAPASNNTSSSVLIQDFTSVSDGAAQLNVEATQILYTKGALSFAIKYSYIPNAVNGVVNNTGVTAVLTQDSAKPVVSGVGGVIINTTSTGTVSGTTAALPGVGEVNTATLTITAPGGGLQRKITVRLRQPYNFVNVYTNPTIIANATDQPVDLHFTIPNNFNAGDYPMPIYIYTQKLSPNIQAGGENLTLDFTSGVYRYKYLAHGPGEQIAYFISNSINSTEQIKITGGYFSDATYLTNTAVQSPLVNLNFTPNGATLPAQKGQTVTMTFDIPVVAGVNPPFAININTTKLTFQSSTTGTATATSFGYLYTTNTSGTKTIVFKTKASDSDEYVRIYEARYASIGFRRLCTKMDLVNPRFDAVNGLGGTAVSFRLGIPALYNFAANNNICEVFIYTSQLEPATGNPSDLVQVIHPQFGVGYKYTATTSADQQVQLKTVNNYSYETARINSDGFNESQIVRTFSFLAASFNAKPTNTSNTNTTMTLTLSVPAGSIPSGGLTIRIDSQDVLVAFPTTQTNLTRVGVDNLTTGYFEYRITTAGTYNITFRNRVSTASTRQKVIPISAPGFVTIANVN